MKTYTLTNMLFDDFFTNFDSSFLDGDYSYWRRKEDKLTRKDNDNTYEYSLELPGYSKKDIGVSIKEGLIKVLAKKGGEETKGCSFFIPKDADAGKTFAEHKDGLLTITITKKEETKPTEIKVK